MGKEDSGLSQQESREFTSNQSNQNYVSNEIKSTTTNVITFVPINLFKQLHNMANIYFIIIAILQTIPSISVTGGSPTILLPLAFVMLAVMVKDAYEEYYRYRKDKEENEREIDLLVGGNFQIRHWGDLRVGDVIKMRKDTLIPCDCMVIKTSDPENKGFVETKGLDGETNLKLKVSFLNNIPNNIARDPNYQSLPYKVTCGAPAMQLNKFDGMVEYDNLRIPLDGGNLMLRGCVLKTVHEVIAVCCYTGADTKVVLNSAKFEPKKSKLMVEVDKIVIQIFIWQVIISLVCSLFNTILENSYSAIMAYIPSSNYWLLTATWWLLLTYFVPISLIVTMQMVKLFQGSLLVRDKAGYSEEYDFYTTANNTSVNENLGQIKYVFTDKTGTLTKNNMIFKNLICDGKLYGVDQEGVAFRKKEVGVARKTVDFKDDKFQRDKSNPKVQDALKVISLCHQIAVEIDGGNRNYNSSSPDEVALIYFAKQEGKELLGEERRMVKIAERRPNGSSQVVQYEKLCILEFNSDRKRMSIIIRDPQTRRIELYCKGADSTVKALLRPGQQDLEPTQKYIDKLSVKGLRTLMLGKKVISEQEFQQWNRRLLESRSIIGEEKKSRISQCYEAIQANLELVGATAIEDELQDEVKETIQTMRLSGMMFYILTGDKQETAETIGRSCGLIDEGFTTVHIPEYDEDRDQEWRTNFLNITRNKEAKIFMLNAQKSIPPDIPLHSTICYRCTPKNKEEIVRRVKEKTTHLTMAVGDGSNDVNMIKEAHVGIGIKGKQGTEAARVADYVAGEFKFIKLLTLYYGREWYRKNCELVNYSFYKNWFQNATIIVYGGFSFFSGVVFFNSYIYQLYNVFYTSLPIILYALFDEQHTKRESYRRFDVYEPGINNYYFNQSTFLKTIGVSILHGVIALLIVFELLESGTLDESGITGYLKLSGAVLFGVIIIIVNCKIMAMSTGIKLLNTIVILISISLYWASQALVGWFFKSPTEFVLLKEQWSYTAIWLVTIILVFFLVIIEFGYDKYKAFQNSYLLVKKKETLGGDLFDKIEKENKKDKWQPGNTDNNSGNRYNNPGNNYGNNPGNGPSNGYNNYGNNNRYGNNNGYNNPNNYRRN